MEEETPSLEEWRRLYKAAQQVKELAPWEYMDEEDLFGVQNPETGEVGFVSVMGSLGEHYAVALYPGASGFYGFWNMQAAGPTLQPEDVLHVPQLQASFEDREQLDQEDRKVIKSLGLKFRGRQAWLQFRSYLPGFFPWHLNAAEAVFLTHALEQLLDVAPRFLEDPDLFDPSEEEELYLLRAPVHEHSSLRWEDRTTPPPQNEPESYIIPMEIALLEHLKSLPKTDTVLEVDLAWMPSPIREGEGRPFWPYNLLIVDSKSGMILGHELLHVETTFMEMLAQVPFTIVSELAHIGLRPKEIRVLEGWLPGLLRLLEDELDFKVKTVKRLRKMEPIKQALFERFV